MQDVSLQLQSMNGVLQTLVERSERSTPGSSEAGPSRRPSHLHAQEAREANEGFKGDSSFDAHAASIADAVRSHGSPYRDSGGLQALHDLPDLCPNVNDSGAPMYHVDIEDWPLPPPQQISRILRLLQREKQRFFYDVPIIGEQEFVSLCKAVCFPTESYLLSSWIIVNTGLYYLFHSLSDRHHAELGITAEEVHEYVQQLASNLDAAGHDLRLCLEPSMKTCSALVMLVCNSFIPAQKVLSNPYHRASTTARTDAKLQPGV